MRTKVIIMGAAGRDFHNFNVFFKDNEDYEVVAFTAAQIPGIAGRVYPVELAGSLYERDIPIYQEEELPGLIKEQDIEQVVLAYSDLSHEAVMQKASLVLAAGADFRLMGTKSTMLRSNKPVISVCAVRTGAGKSPTSQKLVDLLKEKGLRVVVVRHPMPYGDLLKQECQRFASMEDCILNECTIEEREEYEPYICCGTVVYSGINHKKILSMAEKEADIIIWDGGNNDLPFYWPDLHIVVADPLRPGHELTYYPGDVNIRLADVVIVNKVNSAREEDVELVINNIKSINNRAMIIKAMSVITPDEPELIRGKRVLVVEDGPTLTHGGMAFGAGFIAAREYGAKEVIDPRAHAVGSISNTYEEFPHLGTVLPAMGYGPIQMKELEMTINAAECDTVIAGTPVDLGSLLKLNKPVVKVRYRLQEIDTRLEDIVDKWLESR
ncbi:putative GTPase [Candidatus Methanoperedens nitroreducens]|uniref:Putative GTPase n=1 Tax=Candidatus Methanoperedens nitratireducens TaxID=1392998 RepID=A0A062V4E6_9EURY|nr:cyclic 2,3-diphosphoglycerate synthase [Candidatus Methanoperedens nitroreducens]KCZ72227.1 putative GTPase [Candidatus Methanoperedens nitroreducens]MDJ1421796.1 cyclic 2,3-diphosphoglycerate synthase [Candidatus Methanoperedens sp.]